MSTALDRLTTALSDRYAIRRELGAGGMATVYLAHDIKHDRDVAIKVLKPELAAVLGADRFVVEIKTTAALQHPHILPLFDSGSADGFLFYVMPYIQGETLRAKLDRETQFGIDDAVRIARDVADALDYAHRHGVVHRDIKPENVLLHDGRPMVADFGIALALSAAAGGRMTETGMSLGTPHYMSPEQATADKEISGRSDIYSLGSVLYEMLAGQPPHLGGSAQQIIMKIIASPVEPVTTYRKSVPPNVAAAVAKSLEKLPADRFESAKAFADALGNSAFTTMHATGVGGGAAARSSRRAFVAMSVLAAVATIGLVAAIAGSFDPATVEPPVVRFKFQAGQGQRISLNRGIDAPFALSPNGTSIAYTALDSGAQRVTLHLRSLDQFTTTSFPGTEGALQAFWSPDGLWIGFLTADRSIGKVAVTGGPVTMLASGVDRLNGAPSWGDDHFIVFSMNDVAYRVADGSGAATPLADSATGPQGVAAPVILPGSRAVLLTVCRGVPRAGCERDLGAIDVATGEMKVLVEGATRGWYLPSGHLVYGTREGALFAVTFDLKSLAVTSSPVGVLAGVQTSTGFGLPHVAISASGSLAYLPGTANGGSVIVQTDRSGREDVIVSKPSSYSGPRLSPDGRRLVLVDYDAKGVSQVWIHDRASLTTRQLTFEGRSVRPAWSPDGGRVAFSTTRGGVSNVWLMPADGSDAGKKAGEGRHVNGATAVFWTRDGKWLVVDGVPDDNKGSGGEDVFAIPLLGAPGPMQPAVATSFNEETGDVSPDGKWIAYVSDDAGTDQLYVQPFLTPGGRTLVSSGRASEPAWASNNELAYINNVGDSLMLAHLAFGPTITVTRTALFGTRNYLRGGPSLREYDVSADGRHFIFVKPLTGDDRPDPVVVLNWTAEMKRLLAAAGVK